MEIEEFITLFHKDHKQAHVWIEANHSKALILITKYSEQVASLYKYEQFMDLLRIDKMNAVRLVYKQPDIMCKIFQNSTQFRELAEKHSSIALEIIGYKPGEIASLFQTAEQFTGFFKTCIGPATYMIKKDATSSHRIASLYTDSVLNDLDKTDNSLCSWICVLLNKKPLESQLHSKSNKLRLLATGGSSANTSIQECNTRPQTQAQERLVSTTQQQDIRSIPNNMLNQNRLFPASNQNQPRKVEPDSGTNNWFSLQFLLKHTGVALIIIGIALIIKLPIVAIASVGVGIYCLNCKPM